MKWPAHPSTPDATSSAAAFSPAVDAECRTFATPCFWKRRPGTELRRGHPQRSVRPDRFRATGALLSPNARRSKSLSIDRMTIAADRSSPANFVCSSNENDRCALTVMPDRRPPSDSTGPMGTQPVDHGRAPTQMLPTMPVAKGNNEPETKVPAPQGKRTRAQAVRAALARITRRNSLRKQRNAQKGEP